MAAERNASPPHRKKIIVPTVPLTWDCGGPRCLHRVGLLRERLDAEGNREGEHLKRHSRAGGGGGAVALYLHYTERNSALCLVWAVAGAGRSRAAPSSVKAIPAPHLLPLSSSHVTAASNETKRAWTCRCEPKLMGDKEAAGLSVNVTSVHVYTSTWWNRAHTEHVPCSDH